MIFAKAYDITGQSQLLITIMIEKVRDLLLRTHSSAYNFKLKALVSNMDICWMYTCYKKKILQHKAVVVH